MTDLVASEGAGSPPRNRGPAPEEIGRARLPLRELVGVALQCIRTRKLRASLSSLGIAIGIGGLVAVVVVS
ncbi:MAG: hypothetical protein ACRDKL_04525, partial [Solirubrobacteraceae bacterium]